MKNQENEVKQFNSIDQVWATIDSGKTIYWKTKAFVLTVEDSNLDWRKENGFVIPFSNRDGKSLRVTSVKTYAFGSLLTEKDIQGLFTEEAL